MLNKIKKYIRKSYFYKFYLNIQKNKIVRNYFKKNNQKKSLICYKTDPFIKRKINYEHTNSQEVFSIAKVLDKLNFNCDIINFNCNKQIDFNKYNLIIGFGASFNNSFNTTKKNIKRIYYGTGKHPYFSNKKTLERGLEFYKKTGFFIKQSLRIVEDDYLLQTKMCDELIVIGDEYTKKTYEKYTDKKINLIKVTYINSIKNPETIINNKDFPKIKNNFLFFSGSGMIHKGLDLVIDIFTKRDDINLNICAPLESEEVFLNTYKEKINKKNIRSFGFIPIKSKRFKEMMSENSFIILPSCSEAMPTSVINCVANGGLIPILSKESSINLDNKCIMIEDLNTEMIEKSINDVLNFNSETIKNDSLAIQKIIKDENSIVNFEKRIEKILEKY